jgi:hypothetical protein
MTNPNLPPSDEVRHEEITDAVISVDWESRFSGKADRYRKLGTYLENEQDPDSIIEITEARGESLVGVLGSGALSLNRRDVLAEREAFEAEFGEQ